MRENSEWQARVVVIIAVIVYYGVGSMKQSKERKREEEAEDEEDQVSCAQNKNHNVKKNIKQFLIETAYSTHPTLF